MKTGFKDLDEIIEVNGGDLIVVASRPAMGKSAFVLNILRHIVFEEKKKVLLFSLEESKEHILNELITSNSSVEDTQIYIESDAPYSINDICTNLIKYKKEKNIDAVIIDYLQLIQFSEENNLSIENEILENLEKLKKLAQSFDIPIIVTSQLSGKCEKRENKRPIMEDFSNSKKAIDTYADKILFLYRDSYYNKDNKSNITEIIIAKDGVECMKIAYLQWLPEYLKFD